MLAIRTSQSAHFSLVYDPMLNRPRTNAPIERPRARSQASHHECGAGPRERHVAGGLWAPNSPPRAGLYPTASDSQKRLSARPIVPQRRFWFGESRSGSVGGRETERGAKPLSGSAWRRDPTPASGADGGLPVGGAMACSGGSGLRAVLSSGNVLSADGPSTDGPSFADEVDPSRSWAWAWVGPRASVRARAARRSVGKAHWAFRMADEWWLCVSVDRHVCGLWRSSWGLRTREETGEIPFEKSVCGRSGDLEPDLHRQADVLAPGADGGREPRLHPAAPVVLLRGA